MLLRLLTRRDQFPEDKNLVLIQLSVKFSMLLPDRGGLFSSIILPEGGSPAPSRACQHGQNGLGKP